MIRLNLIFFSEFLMTWLQSSKSTNFKFALRAKPDLPALVQSILRNYQHGIICNFTGLQTSTQFDQESGAKGSITDSRVIKFRRSSQCSFPIESITLIMA